MSTIVKIKRRQLIPWKSKKKMLAVTGPENWATM